MVAHLYLIRHGETEWSRTGRHTGRTDLPLTEYGERQASNLRRLLYRARFSDVLVSPMQRALQTCQLAGYGAAARVEQNLSEWNYGDYEGLTIDEIHAQRPGWDIFRDGCPRGESPEQVAKRVTAVLGEVRQIEGNVAFFSHGHLLRTLAMRWCELAIRDGRRFFLDAASLSILGYANGNAAAPAVLLWNAVSDMVLLPADSRPNA
jgi:broad specificity phosphatase PhoE